jgi:hypothetical protein
MSQFNISGQSDKPAITKAFNFAGGISLLVGVFALMASAEFGAVVFACGLSSLFASLLWFGIGYGLHRLDRMSRNIQRVADLSRNAQWLADMSRLMKEEEQQQA